MGYDEDETRTVRRPGALSNGLAPGLLYKLATWALAGLLALACWTYQGHLATEQAERAKVEGQLDLARAGLANVQIDIATLKADRGNDRERLARIEAKVDEVLRAVGKGGRQ